MTQYYIVEIKKMDTSEFEHQVHWAFDADATMARLKAESKYHQVLAAAAISEYAQHSATLLSSDGRLIASQCYKHEVAEEVEPEVEPTE